MKNLFLQLKKQVPRATALLLCIWLSGVVCAFNCEFPNAGTISAAETAVADNDSNLPPCHHAARAKSKKTKEEFSFEKSDFASNGNYCPLLSASFATPAKNFKFVGAALQTAKAASNSAPVLNKQKTVFYSNYKPFRQPRGSTYLKNRVLLI